MILAMMVLLFSVVSAVPGLCCGLQFSESNSIPTLAACCAESCARPAPLDTSSPRQNPADCPETCALLAGAIADPTLANSATLPVAIPDTPPLTIDLSVYWQPLATPLPEAFPLPAASSNRIHLQVSVLLC